MKLRYTTKIKISQMIGLMVILLGLVTSVTLLCLKPNAYELLPNNSILSQFLQDYSWISFSLILGLVPLCYSITSLKDISDKDKSVINSYNSAFQIIIWLTVIILGAFVFILNRHYADFVYFILGAIISSTINYLYLKVVLNIKKEA